MSEKAEKTREKILDTAIKHFLRDGFSGASLRSIVKDAGLTTEHFISTIQLRKCFLMHLLIRI